jgi:GH15 family glucan-1,4-alpha-glucosidase
VGGEVRDVSLRTEDYGLIGDTQTAALVGRDGSIDWLCLPRFDSAAAFAALLGSRDNGRWQIAPAKVKSTRRRYRGETLILETEFEAPEGSVRLIDFMPIRDHLPHLVRIVEGLSGTVPMRLDLLFRFDYGSTIPWVRRIDHRLVAIAGPNGVTLQTPVELHGRDLATTAEFSVSAGQRIPFVMSWYQSELEPPEAIDPDAAERETEEWWEAWSRRCTYPGPWHDAVVRSLITLKALTFGPTGGIVAAPTTSLPEQLGGVRNWDYRYCWVRDATLTLYALMQGGYRDEAAAWRDWLLRAVAGDPRQLQTLYGVAGEKLIPEIEVPWLPGYEGAGPVRVGNAAVTQFQLDVFGELMDALYAARRIGLPPEAAAWQLQRHLMAQLERVWRDPDEGIWEVRGGQRHFTHSRVMAWLAVDRSIKAIENLGLEGPLDSWRRVRAEIHADVLAHGYDADLGSFVQSYGSKKLDAALLMIPLVGFLPATDSRVRGTVSAIEHGLLRDGFVLRYDTDEANPDGLPPGEGAFLPCTFWFADALASVGRDDEARRVFERLLGIRNDLGLLSEEYDTGAKRLVGNFPQAFSHVGLVNSATNLAPTMKGTTRHRTGDETEAGDKVGEPSLMRGGSSAGSPGGRGVVPPGADGPRGRSRA